MKYLIIFLLLGCTRVFKNKFLEILDSNNDCSHEMDIFFLQNLINNSRGFNNTAPNSLRPLKLGYKF